MKRLTLLCTAVALLATADITPAAVVTTFVEDFATTTYKDAVNTTADWNTTDGELKLFPFVPSLVGSFNTSGVATGVAVRGNLAYVSDGPNGLVVLDISDPTAPALVGGVASFDASYAVDVAGDYAYLADYSAGMLVIDVSDPTTPVAAGLYNTSGNALDVAVAGNYAYVADDFDGGLLILDISDPTVPTFVGLNNTPGQAFGVDVAGKRVFVADGTAGLQVIDISFPFVPSIIATYDTPFEARDVFVSGDLAYVADGVTGLIVLDISDPFNPVLVGSHATGGYSVEVFIDGDNAYLADDFGGVAVLDVSDPANPTTLHTIPTPAGGAQHLVVDGVHAYVADYSGGLQVLEVAALTGPTPAGFFASPDFSSGVFVAGNHALIADGPNGLTVLDVSDPAGPTLLGNLPFTGGVYGVYAEGNHAYTVGDSGLAVVDITDPASPSLLGSLNTPTIAIDVVVSGKYAYVSDYYAGPIVIDVSNPAAPTMVDSLLISFCWPILVDGDYAYTTGQGELKVIDISDPTNIALIGSSSNGSTVPRGLAIQGDLVFVADFTLQVFDVSDPTNPVLIGNHALAGNGDDVYVTGNLAFVTSRINAAFEVFDVSDPANPALIESLPFPEDLSGVTVAGDHAFVAGTTGLQTFFVHQGRVLPGPNIGHSTIVDQTDDEIIRVRLTPTEATGVSWEFSADAGATFDSVLAGEWHALSAPGDDFKWRSRHTYLGENPVVSNLQVDWLHHYAPIASVEDIPNDQGRQVSVEWTRSGHDFVGDPQQIVEYAVYRKIDPGLTAVSPAAARSFDHLSPAARENALMMQAAGWHFLLTVPVLVEDSYAVVVPTLADSTIAKGDYNTTFRVTALTATPGVFFHSPPDSGYSTDDLAPNVPANLVIAHNTGSGNTLSWDDPTDADFQHFRVYRSTNPSFTPTENELVHSTTSTGWTDPDEDGGAVYYKVTALDHSGNESDAATSGTVTSVPSQRPADNWALDANVPNPFNPTTQIRYTVPASGGGVSLQVFDVRGRLVRTLVDGPGAPGQNTVTWDGRDTRGQSVASGVYFYRLQGKGFTSTRKMVLAK